MGGVKNPDHQVYDVLVIGGGPAGLAAALGFATEHLKLCVLEADCKCGGQAGHALRVENFPGVFGGVRGASLMDKTRKQIIRHGGVVQQDASVARVKKTHDGFVAICRDGRRFSARAVVIATGVSWRTLPVFDDYVDGDRVQYGSPGAYRLFFGHSVLVVGGGNSAGQAALHIARRRGARAVHLVMRCGFGSNMSAYLVEQIEKCGRIFVYEGTTVRTVGRQDKGLVASIGEREELFVRDAYLFPGGVPNTACVRDLAGIELDDQGFVVASPPGVFVAGDVQAGAVRRIAAAAGAGAMLVPRVYTYLAA